MIKIMKLAHQKQHNAKNQYVTKLSTAKSLQKN
jgi:hypothetical protein